MIDKVMAIYGIYRHKVKEGWQIGDTCKCFFFIDFVENEFLRIFLLKNSFVSAFYQSSR